MSQYNEPWSIDPLYLFIMDKNGEKIEFCGSEENENRLHRMITSVNYCAGEPDASLELFTAKEQVDLKVKFFNEANTYRDLCVELLSSLKDMVDMDCPLIGSPSKEDLLDFWEHEKSQGRGIAGEMLTALNAITKAEALMGEKA